MKKDETHLIAWVLKDNEVVIAFTDMERGTFSNEYYPDYVIETVPHKPWQDPIFKHPKSELVIMMKIVAYQEEACFDADTYTTDLLAKFGCTRYSSAHLPPNLHPLRSRSSLIKTTWTSTWPCS